MCPLHLRYLLTGISDRAFHLFLGLTENSCISNHWHDLIIATSDSSDGSYLHFIRNEKT